MNQYRRREKNINIHIENIDYWESMYDISRMKKKSVPFNVDVISLAQNRRIENHASAMALSLSSLLVGVTVVVKGRYHTILHIKTCDKAIWRYKILMFLLFKLKLSGGRGSISKRIPPSNRWQSSVFSNIWLSIHHSTSIKLDINNNTSLEIGAPSHTGVQTQQERNKNPAPIDVEWWSNFG